MAAVSSHPMVPARRGYLPPQPTHLVDRANDVAAIRALVTSEQVHLVTITGAGGIGKTRLAIAVAEQVLDAFDDGVWFIELAPILDAGLVLSTIAVNLRLQESPSTDPLAALVDHLHQRSTLLVLDNLEHLRDAIPAIDRLLTACPGLTILTTSREPLRLRREHVVEAMPLGVPDRSRTWTAVELATVPSVALFVERAVAADAAFQLTDNNATAVAELAVLLGGLPLAIELAAIRTPVLSPAALVDRMDHQLALLRWDAPDLPPRQRTLRATLDWSYALLSPEEQCVFRRLGVFVGGFTLDAAAAVTDTLGLGVDVLDVVASLLAKHQLRSFPHADGEPRFQMLNLVREYALERLEASGETATIRDRHLAYFHMKQRPFMSGVDSESDEFLLRLDPDLDNLRAALTWAIAQGDIEAEWWLVVAFWPLWVGRGLLHEITVCVEAALTRASAIGSTLLAHMLELAALLAWLSRDDERAMARYEQKLSLARQAGQDELGAGFLIYRSLIAHKQGDAERARAYVTEANQRVRNTAASPDIGWGMGPVLLALGPPLTTREREWLRIGLEGPIAFLRENAKLVPLAIALAGHAHVLFDVDRRAAFVSVRESLEVSRASRYRPVTFVATGLAMELFGDHLLPVRIARLHGAAAALHEQAQQMGGLAFVTNTFSASESYQLAEQVVARAMATIGEDAFTAAMAEGRSFSHEQFTDEVLAALLEAESMIGASDGTVVNVVNVVNVQRAGDGLLSAREREVLAAVATGRSNKEIGELLFISPHTVKTHVTSLLNKLGADTRAQLVAIAAERGLL